MEDPADRVEVVGLVRPGELHLGQRAREGVAQLAVAGDQRVFSEKTKSGEPCLGDEGAARARRRSWRCGARGLDARELVHHARLVADEGRAVVSGTRHALRLLVAQLARLR